MNLKQRSTQMIIIVVSLLCLFPALLAIGLMSPYYERPQIANLPLAGATITLVATLPPIPTPTADPLSTGATGGGGTSITTPNPGETPAAETPPDQPPPAGPTSAIPEPTEAAAAQPPAGPEPVDFATVTANGVANLRIGPGLDFDVVAAARNGDVLPVYERSSDGVWLLIDPARPLWIATELVRLDGGDVAAIPITGQ